MSTKAKDQRRADLVVPYKAPVIKENETDMSSTVSSTMPMAAMFTKNRMIAWVSLIFAIQTWLQESPRSRAAGKQPAIFSILFGLVAMGVCYMPQPNKLSFPLGDQGTSTAPVEPIPAAGL